MGLSFEQLAAEVSRKIPARHPYDLYRLAIEDPSGENGSVTNLEKAVQVMIELCQKNNRFDLREQLQQLAI